MYSSQGQGRIIRSPSSPVWDGRLVHLSSERKNFAAAQHSNVPQSSLDEGKVIRANTTNEILDGGYIIGPRGSPMIFSGGVFAWMVVMPRHQILWIALATNLYTGHQKYADMSPDESLASI